jgi:hypothetical protein
MRDHHESRFTHHGSDTNPSGKIARSRLRGVTRCGVPGLPGDVE